MRTRLCFLNVQPQTLLVGKPGGFSTPEDFYRFAAQECGFTGVTMPSGFLDLGQAIESSDYRSAFQENLRKCGLTDGLVRMEMHVDGQNVCVHPARAKRFGHFIDPNGFRSMNHTQLEEEGARRVKMAIDASAAFGFKDLPGFCGGRGFPAAMAKWSAWPKHFAPWVMALLALKWNPILEHAADRGVTVTFEFGHPETDILTGANFVMFYNMLTPKARTAVGVNDDWSHRLNIGVHPMPHSKKAASTGCRFTNHYKWGGMVDQGNGNASSYGGWDEWSAASTTFFTFATVGPDQLARDYHDFQVERAEAQGDDVLDVVYEGEDATIRDPRQAMRIGAENCRAAMNGTPFIKVEGVVDEYAFTLTNPPDESAEPSQVQIVGADGLPIAMEAWEGGPFDAAFDSPLTPAELLEMDAKEVAGCREILEQAGFTEAAKAKGLPGASSASAQIELTLQPAGSPGKVRPKRETARTPAKKPALVPPENE